MNARAMPPTRHMRAEHAVEDLLSARPGGAATLEVVDRLAFVGLTETEALDLLMELREQGRVGLRAGAWVLPPRSGDRSMKR